ncbi:senescence-associated protein-domain-containing protein [Jimgerdemannia flammicorona]|uniref:Senescence-associated protein-domain-containing protein n=1 Tax=Jimgerdemannia flammicorona TaxID=994334 RepID=A0A433AD92_9FUNG|nr:senescence-associated protein-domain-containing protein [Jimgerdemannia flammicorona]
MRQSQEPAPKNPWRFLEQIHLFPNQTNMVHLTNTDNVPTLLLTIPTVRCYFLRDGVTTTLGEGEANVHHVFVPCAGIESGDCEQVDDGCLLTVGVKNEGGAKRNILTLPLVSQSKAWQEEEKTFAFPAPDGGVYKLEMLSANPTTLDFLSDLLTHLVTFENRHRIRNAFALVDPVSGEVMEQLVADDVVLGPQDDSSWDEESVAASDDLAVGSSFLPSRMGVGAKEPIVVDEEQIRLMRKARRIRNMNTTGDILVVSSGLMAQGMVKGATILARGISSGSRMIEKRIQPRNTPLRFSEETKAKLAAARRLSGAVYHATTTTLTATVTTASKLIPVPPAPSDTPAPPSEAAAAAHLGLSTLRAAVNLLTGLGTTAAILGASARDGVMRVVERRYGMNARVFWGRQEDVLGRVQEGH